MSALLAIPTGGGLTVELEPSLNITIHQGERVMTVTNVEGLRAALAAVLEYRGVRETVARDEAGR